MVAYFFAIDDSGALPSYELPRAPRAPSYVCYKGIRTWHEHVLANIITRFIRWEISALIVSWTGTFRLCGPILWCTPIGAVTELPSLLRETNYQHTQQETQFGQI